MTFFEISKDEILNVFPKGTWKRLDVEDMEYADEAVVESQRKRYEDAGWTVVKVAQLPSGHFSLKVYKREDDYDRTTTDQPHTETAIPAKLG